MAVPVALRAHVWLPPAATTVRVALPSAGPALATTRVEPGARAITTPDALISATDVSLTDHANGPVTGWPCAFVPVAPAATESPTRAVLRGSVTAMVTAREGPTVTVAVPL